MLARLVYYLHRDWSLSLITGFLFLIGVSHFQAIHHISALDYPLSLALGLGAALAYLRFADGQNGKYLVLSLALIVLSAGAHISAIVLLPIALLWHRRSIPGPWLWAAIIALCALPLIALARRSPSAKSACHARCPPCPRPATSSPSSTNWASKADLFAPLPCCKEARLQY